MKSTTFLGVIATECDGLNRCLFPVSEWNAMEWRVEGFPLFAYLFATYSPLS
jgi:hypothetical protein